MIVSGHQRVRACKELKIKEVNCRVKIYEPTEQWTIEDVILKELLETNLRQRGIGNTNPIKLARCIVELERLYGIKNGGDKKADLNNSNLKTQKELAKDFNIDQSQLANYKKLLTLHPELQDLVESGELKATTAYKVWGKLSQDEQKDFLDRLGDEKVISMSGEDTKKEIEKLKTENKSQRSENEKLKSEIESHTTKETNYQQEIEQLKSQEPIIKEVVKEVTVEVIPSDYEQIKQQLETISKEKEDLQLQISNTDNKAETPQQFTATSFIHSIEKLSDYCYHFGKFLEKQDNVTEEQAEGYLQHIEMVKKNIKVLEDSIKEFVEDDSDISSYVFDEDELDWDYLMGKDVPEKEPEEEELPESMQITQEILKNEFDDDISEKPIDEPATPIVELDSVEVRTRILTANPDMTLSQYFLMELNIPKSEFYKKLEKSLGMYDQNLKLAIPLTDYIKLMSRKSIEITNGKVKKQVKEIKSQNNTKEGI